MTRNPKTYAVSHKRVKPKACFFAKVRDRGVLSRFEFYVQDIRILEELGFDVQIATHPVQIRPADLYFVWWWTWAFFPIAAARILRRPVVVTGTFDLWAFDSRPKLHQRLIRFALEHADANVFVSRMELEQVPKHLRVKRPRYIPHVVDSGIYRPNGDTREDVIFSVGWLMEGNAERKGMPDIIRAAPLIRKAHPEVRFVIGGEKGSAYPSLQKLAQDLDVADAFEFLGEISAEEKIQRMQRCKIYLQPSKFEGFGLAILEAMSCGAPVVSRPVGAVPEVVGDAAVLVDTESPEAIAQAVNRLLDEPQILREFSKRSRLRAVEHFPFERRRRELQELVHELLPEN